jgi:aspartate racemase
MIGIIGGIGPAAGLNLARLITEQVKVQKDQDHVPWILMNQSARIVDRTEYLLGKVEENPGDEIANQILTLEKAGCTVAGIACNTAHAPAIFDRTKKILDEAGSKIHLLNVIDEMLKYSKSHLKEGEKIGILGTTGSYLIKLHEVPLQNSGFVVIDPGLEMQEEMIHKSIYHPEWGIKAKPDPPASECLLRLQVAIDFYRLGGATALVLGCSEISLVIDNLDTEGLFQIRPMTVLAREIIINFKTQ